MRRLSFALLPLSLLLGCHSADETAKKPAPPPAEVSVITVTPQDTPVSYEYVGQTESSHQVEIRARVSGFLDKRVYTEGGLVKAGDVMFIQDARPFQAALSANKGALAQEQARLETARADLARVGPLAKLNALSQKDLTDATGREQAASAGVATAGANVEQAQLNLNYTTITTPVSGRASYARVQEGAYVSAENSLLTTVEQVDPMWVNFTLSENEILKFRRDQESGVLRTAGPESFEVEVQLADGSVVPDKGRITFLNANYSQQTGTFLVRATLPNRKDLLRPGQFVRVRVLGAVRPAAILIPQKAVMNGAQGHFVWVVGKDAKVQSRPVEVGPWHGDAWFIIGGLAAGDTVAVDGLMRLAPGAAVKVVEAAAPGEGSSTDSPPPASSAKP